METKLVVRKGQLALLVSMHLLSYSLQAYTLLYIILYFIHFTIHVKSPRKFLRIGFYITVLMF